MLVVDFMTAEELKELKCSLAIPVAVLYEHYQEEEHGTPPTKKALVFHGTPNEQIFKLFLLHKIKLHY